MLGDVWELLDFEFRWFFPSCDGPYDDFFAPRLLCGYRSLLGFFWTSLKAVEHRSVNFCFLAVEAGLHGIRKLCQVDHLRASINAQVGNANVGGESHGR